MPEAPQEQPVPPPVVPEETENSDYEAASRSTADFVQAVKPPKAKKSKKPLVIILIILLIAALAATGYFLFLKKDPKPVENTQPEPVSQAPAAETADAALNEHYVSQDLHLALDHPSSWKLDNSIDGQIKLESPITKLANAEGEQMDARIVLTILSSGSQPPGFTGNTGQAVAESEKFAYKAPTQNQRKETFLSFLGFGGGNDVDAIYITGDSGYQKGQTVPKTDVAKVEPVVGVVFVHCEGANCKDSLGIPHETWASNGTLKTAKSILESLVIE